MGPTSSAEAGASTPTGDTAQSVEIQAALAPRGQHRVPSIPDLLIAATAELAELTGQATERLEIG